MSEPVTYFKCRVTHDNINGEFVQEGFSKGTISLSRSIKPQTSYLYKDTLFMSGKNKIACRIYFPKESNKFPSVVFMHGSGAEGMFANQYLAEYLASKGMVTLIQDKQGVGKSTGNWTTATFDDLTTDYVNAVNFLKEFSKVNKSQIGIYGHSQGGTLAPLVASKSKSISFIIAAASVGDTVYKQDLYRVENNLKSNDFTKTEVQEAMTYYRQWLDMARTGIGFEKLDALNNGSKGKKWFEWVEAPPREHWIWKYYLATGNYNSLDYWKKVTVPILLVYGENDQIEDIKSYLHNIDNSQTSGQKNTKDITEIILPDAQHNLCIFPNKKDKFFWWYLSRGYVDLIAGWIKYRFKN
jgi:alpha-beta hydrolase superfamily lysophospholipase